MTLSALKHHHIIKTAHTVCQKAGTRGYLVGGAVRDALMGKYERGDCDFVVDTALDQVSTLFAGTVGGKTIAWDQSQRRIVFKQGQERVSVDFSLLKGNTITEDLFKRDFTVNAIAVDLESLLTSARPCLIDPLNGAGDIANRAVECCLDTTFDEDPLRMLRVVRFERQCGFKSTPRTLSLMQQKAPLIHTVSKERIIREFFTTLNFENARQSLAALHETGLLERLIPETARFHTTTQGPPHLLNLFEHLLLTVEKLDEILRDVPELFSGAADCFKDALTREVEEGVTRKALLIFSAFLHDSGKTETRACDGEKITFYGHEGKGVQINTAICTRLGLSKDAARMVGQVTANHMRVFNLLNLERVTNRAIERFLRDAGEMLPELILLAAADSAAKGGEMAPRTEETLFPFLNHLLGIFMEKTGAPDHRELLTGKEIMGILKIAQGPRVGVLIRKLRQLEAEGRCNTKDEAIAWIKQLPSQP